MNARVWWTGLGGGVLVTGVLIYPLYYYFPGLFVKDWQAGNGTAAWILGVLAVLLLPAIGSLAARLSGLNGRSGAGLAGGLAGGLSALVALVLIVNPAAGIWGNKVLLLHGLQPYTDNTLFISQLMNSTILVISRSYLAFWGTLLAGVLLGALGGLAVVPKGRPDGHLTTMAVPMSIAGMISAVMVFMASLSVFMLLSGIVQKAADKVSYSPTYPIAWIGWFAAVTAMLYLLGWQVLAWLALRKAVVNAPVWLLSWDISGWVNGLMPLVLLALFWLLNRDTTVKYPLAALLAILLSFAAGFPALRLVWSSRRLPRAAEHGRIPIRYFLAGILVLFFLVVFGLYFGGLGSAINLIMLPIVMLQAIIPVESAASIPSPFPEGLPGVVKANYLAFLYPGINFIITVVFAILLLTILSWLIDWYGIRLAAWLRSRMRPPDPQRNP